MDNSVSEALNPPWEQKIATFYSIWNVSNKCFLPVQSQLPHMAACPVMWVDAVLSAEKNFSYEGLDIVLPASCFLFG